MEYTSLEILLNKIANIVLLPPGVNFVLLFLGYWALKRSKKKLANSLFLLATVSLFLFSLPIVSDGLTRSLQTYPALSQNQVKQLSTANSDNIAIVILSGGRLSRASEYGDIDVVSTMTLKRIQYAAWLHRKTQLPILVSGGSVSGESTAEAVLINQTMLSAFNIAPKWIEVQSKNTAENAKFSTDILQKQGIEQILLVTHATHMHRAKLAFDQYGLKVIPAPTAIRSVGASWKDYLPSARGLNESQLALHEMLGRLWYDIRY